MARPKPARPALAERRPPEAVEAPTASRDPLFAAIVARLLLGAELLPFDALTAPRDGAAHRLTTSRVHLHPHAFAAELAAGNEAAVSAIAGAAEHIAAAVRSVVAAVVPHRYRAAVEARESLAWRFPFASVRDASPSAALDVAALLDRPVQLAGDPAVPAHAGVKVPAADGGSVVFIPWSHIDAEPAAVTEAVAALRTSREKAARDAARAITAAVSAARSMGEEEDDVIRRALAAEGLQIWHPHCVAVALAALRDVRDGQRDARLFAMPASQMARVPFEVMAQGETYAGRKLLRVMPGASSPMAPRRAGFRVVWDGHPRGEQFAFGFMLATDPQPAVFRELLRELKSDGLRDYAILHRMAAEQGRTGRFLWTWEAHKRATAHEARVRNSTTRDDDARRATVNRILQLTRAELHAEVQEGDCRAWRVVGDAPLVFISGGAERRGTLEGLVLSLNPALYAGARTNGGAKLRRYFTQLPEAVLSLPSLPFALAMMLGFRWRIARDGGGAVLLSDEEIDAYMDGARWRDKHKSAAAETRSRAIEAVVAAMGPGCRFERVEGRGYLVHPPHAWVDAVVHEVPPELPPSTAKAPRTGAELRAWRDGEGLSQREAARTLGVGFRTVQRAELAPADPLPRSFRRVSWGRPRALPDPVEGEDFQGDG